MSLWKKLGAACLVVAMLSAAGVAGAVVSGVVVRGPGSAPVAKISCPGGMTRLGHPFEEGMTIFEADPAIHISTEYTVPVDFFRVEDIDMGAHAGTHIDAPSHFIEGARSVDQLRAEEFVWPVYKIDVRDMEFEDGLVEKRDIIAYEKIHGNITDGMLVVLQTGAEEFWGAETVAVDGSDNSANIDDFFDFENAGFSGAAVDWLFEKRDIAGVGSDAYGPDAYSDANFDATFNTLAADGIALVAIANLDSVNVRGDVIFASTVALANGSGFSTDPIACHRRADS